MIGAFKDDYTRLTRRQAGRFQSRFHGLESGITKDDFPASTRGPTSKGEFGESPSELRLQRVRMHISHRMQQPCHLTLPRTDDPRICMSRGRDSKCRGEIEVSAPCYVPDVMTAGAFPYNRPTASRIDVGDVARFKPP